MNTSTDPGLAWPAPPAQLPARLQQLRLQVSLNEEHVFLTITLSGERELDLGERSHHYCLLTLARQRLSDARRGIDCSGQGWLGRQQLSDMLGVDIGNLNIQIHRACQQIARALPRGVELGELIERRRGELRFGTLPFCIVRGSSFEGEFIPVRKPV
jgi:hypothetical protein